eukprot:GHVP01036104.1.p2 GENE.GHVP01036104.1~~GHVP01036104.1.p2  ORF type:complete len:120 (+),score=15.89 GHVP01036104.1:690-1049(+)
MRGARLENGDLLTKPKADKITGCAERQYHQGEIQKSQLRTPQFFGITCPGFHGFHSWIQGSWFLNWYDEVIKIERKLSPDALASQHESSCTLNEVVLKYNSIFLPIAEKVDFTKRHLER